MNIRALANKPTLWYALVILMFISILFSWLLILLSYGVDIPRHDQWDTPMHALIKNYEGSMQFGDLFLQHNESRKFVPTSISISLAKLNGYYDTRLELIVSYILKLVIIGLIFIHAVFTCSLNYRFPLTLAFFASAMLFSPNAIWAHMWSITFERLLPDAALLINILLISYFRLNWKLLCILMLNCLIGQYSYAGGIAVWPLTIIMALMRHQLDGSGVAVKGYSLMMVGLASSLAYFWSYTANPTHAPLSAIFEQQPFAIFEFFCVFLGAPFSANRDLAYIFGLIGLVAFTIIGVTVALKFHAQQLSLAILSWVFLGTSSLFQAALATIGRLPMSPDHALRTDYMSHTLFLWVSNFLLLYILLEPWKRLRIFTHVVPFMLSIWLILGMVTPAFWKSLSSFNALFLQAKVCFLYRDYFLDSQCLKPLRNDINHLLPVALRADAVELLRPSKPKGNVHADNPKQGEILKIIEGEDIVTIVGNIFIEENYNGAFLLGRSDKRQLINVVGYGKYEGSQGLWSRILPGVTLRRWVAILKKDSKTSDLNIRDLEVFYVPAETGDLYPVLSKELIKGQ